MRNEEKKPLTAEQFKEAFGANNDEARKLIAAENAAREEAARKAQAKSANKPTDSANG